MRYLLLFAPVILAFLFNDNPVVGFFISWSASLLFIILSITGKIVNLPTDMSWSRQLFRPFIFSQLLFFGYNSISNIFFFLDTLGYYYFEKTNFIIDKELPSKIANIQIITLLAHTVYLIAVLPRIKNYTKIKHLYRINVKESSYLIYAIVLYLLSFLSKGSLLDFLGYYLNSLSIFLALFYVANNLNIKKNIIVSVVVLALLVGNALLSGMKENIIIIIFFLLANLYAKYKWKPIVIAAPFIAVFLYYYPTLNNNYRQLAWDQGVDQYDAFAEVTKAETIKELTIKENNWQFLSIRLSEVSMGVAYFDYVPNKHDFYGFEILLDGINLLIPRILNPDKSSPDVTAMKRATDSGAVSLNENDYTSAKPQTLYDAYMSGGIIGIIITFFLFGWLTIKISIWCEKLFGGYQFGSILIFQSFYSMFNKGGCFENLIGSLFWSTILVYLLFLFMRNRRLLINV